MSRQRDWQLKQLAAGRCQQCGEKNDRDRAICTTCRRKVITQRQRLRIDKHKVNV